MVIFHRISHLNLLATHQEIMLIHSPIQHLQQIQMETMCITGSTGAMVTIADG